MRRNSEKGNIFLALCFLVSGLGSLAILFHAKSMLMVNGLSFMEGLLLGLGAIETVVLTLFSAYFFAAHSVENHRRSLP